MSTKGRCAKLDIDFNSLDQCFPTFFGSCPTSTSRIFWCSPPNPPPRPQHNSQSSSDYININSLIYTSHPLKILKLLQKYSNCPAAERASHVRKHCSRGWYGQITPFRIFLPYCSLSQAPISSSRLTGTLPTRTKPPAFAMRVEYIDHLATRAQKKIKMNISFKIVKYRSCILFSFNSFPLLIIYISVTAA